jgi:hypothetical protein
MTEDDGRMTEEYSTNDGRMTEEYSTNDGRMTEGFLKIYYILYKLYNKR